MREGRLLGEGQEGASPRAGRGQTVQAQGPGGWGRGWAFSLEASRGFRAGEGCGLIYTLQRLLPTEEAVAWVQEK